MNNQLAPYTCILQSEKGFLSLNRSEDRWDRRFQFILESWCWDNSFFELGNIFSKSADLESNSAVIFSVCELKGYSEVLLNKLMALCVFVASIKPLETETVKYSPLEEGLQHQHLQFYMESWNAVYEEDLSYCFHCCNTAWLLTREFSVMFTSSIKFVLCTVVGYCWRCLVMWTKGADLCWWICGIFDQTEFELKCQ